MSRLLVELAEEERRRSLGALARCPRVDVAAGAVAELPADAALLVIEHGIVLLAGTDGRRIVIAIAGPGEVLAPLERRECLRGLTAATVTVMTREAKRALMRIPRRPRRSPTRSSTRSATARRASPASPASRTSSG